MSTDDMYKDLLDHGAVSSGSNDTGHARDLPDTDLSDHGAIAYGSSVGLSGVSRDLSDADLSDHGAIAYGSSASLSGVSRDLPDADLSDHGAIAYSPRSETYGTNDEDIVRQMNILMQASYSNNVNQVVPSLNAASLAKVIDYRYRKSGNILDNSTIGLTNDDRRTLGIQMYMDFLIIDSAISSNPNCLQQIFSPTLYSGQQDKTDIFGVLEQYKQDMDGIGVEIPLINGNNGNPVVDNAGRIFTAQDTLNYLMSKKELYKQENIDGRSL